MILIDFIFSRKELEMHHHAALINGDASLIQDETEVRWMSALQFRGQQHRIGRVSSSYASPHSACSSRAG